MAGITTFRTSLIAHYPATAHPKAAATIYQGLRMKLPSLGGVHRACAAQSAPYTASIKSPTNLPIIPSTAVLLNETTVRRLLGSTYQ